MAFHAALRAAHQAFVSKLEEQTKAVLRQHLDSATSEFAVNLLASLPDIYSEEDDDEGLEGDISGEADAVTHGVQALQVCFMTHQFAVMQ